MRLLITTQKVDENDRVLGFFVSWISEFSKYFDKIIVICLEKGEYKLPENIRVVSLGKEKRNKQGSKRNLRNLQDFLFRILTIARFKYLIFRYSNQYDAVLAHMNPEYILVGGLFWRIAQKKVALWYNHPAWNWRVKIATSLANMVFYTSAQSSTAGLNKAIQMPAGIDTKKFQRIEIEKVHGELGRDSRRSILSMGRIAKYKRIHVILGALGNLFDQGVVFHASVFGNPNSDEMAYYKKMRMLMTGLEQAGVLQYARGVLHKETPMIYNTHEIFINASEAGNFDKTILEAMACESLVLTCNPALSDILPSECKFREDDEEDLALKIEGLFRLSLEQKENIRRKLRQYVVDNHQQEMLGLAIKNAFSSI